MKEKIKLGIFLILTISVIIGIVRESIARKPTEHDFYKKYCSGSNDILCEKFIDL
jgi:hypothetical protein